MLTLFRIEPSMFFLISFLHSLIPGMFSHPFFRVKKKTHVFYPKFCKQEKTFTFFNQKFCRVFLRTRNLSNYFEAF